MGKLVVLHGLAGWLQRILLRDRYQPAPAGAVSCSLGRKPQEFGRRVPTSPNGATSPHTVCPRRVRNVAPPGLERLRASGPWGLRPKLHYVAASRLGLRQIRRAERIEGK